MGLFKFMILLVFIFNLSVSALAESKISLRGQMPYQKASLEVSLNENIYYGGKNRMNFSVSGLKPAAVYSLWLAKGLQNQGLGEPPHSFIADSIGRAVYVAGVEAYRLGNWQTIKIVEHRDANPENIDEDNLVTVFLVDVREFLSGKKAISDSTEQIKPITIYKGPLPATP